MARKCAAAICDIIPLPHFWLYGCRTKGYVACMKQPSKVSDQQTLPESGPSFRLFDAHNDTLILREVRRDPLDFAVEDLAYDVDLPRLRKGNVGGMMVMVGDNDLRQSLRLIDAIHRMPEAHPDSFALARNRADVIAAQQANRIALVMSIEGQAMFGEDMALLRLWHQLGVRVASLSHGEGTFGGPATALQIDPACTRPLSPEQRESLRRREKGLTAFARESLKEMARLNMVLDLTHANDKAFWEALESYPGPICCTHSNCFSLCPVGRNLTDTMMRALAERKGVMGLCFYNAFIDGKAPDLDRFLDHLDHALDIMGPQGVAIGSDFDGIPPSHSLVLKDVAAMESFWSAAIKRFPASVLQQVGWDNLLAILP